MNILSINKFTIPNFLVLSKNGLLKKINKKSTKKFVSKIISRQHIHRKTEFYVSLNYFTHLFVAVNYVCS